MKLGIIGSILSACLALTCGIWLAGTAPKAPAECTALKKEAADLRKENSRLQFLLKELQSAVLDGEPKPKTTP